MRNFMILVAVTLVFATPYARAQDLLPATSEDVNEFDRQISESQSLPSETSEVTDPSKKTKKVNFGQQVSEEAKRLRGSEDKRDFGRSISAERRQDPERRPEAASPSRRNSETSGERIAPDSPARGRDDQTRGRK